MFTPRRSGVSTRWRNSLRANVADGVGGTRSCGRWRGSRSRPRRREALHALRSSVGVELLLRERRHQQARRPSSCFGLRTLSEQLVEIGQRDELALRNVAEIGPCGEVRSAAAELGQEVLREVEVEIKTGKVAAGLFFEFVDLHLGEDHAAVFVMGMGQRIEAGGPEWFSL